MTDEQMRIKIAEACGWTPFEMHGLYLSRWTLWSKGNESKKLHELPDYINDLNAMHEAEKVFTTAEQQNKYQAEIAEIAWGCEEMGHRQVVFNQLTATARQRAEAFIRTLGL